MNFHANDTYVALDIDFEIFFFFFFHLFVFVFYIKTIFTFSFLCVRAHAHTQVAMRGFGYLEPVLNEVAAALGILAKYGSLGVGLTHTTNGTTPISYLNVTPLEQSVTNSVFGAIGQVNLDSFIGATSPTPRASIDRFETTTFDPFRHAGQQAAAPISINTNTYGRATNSTIGAAAAAQTLGGLSKSPTPADVGLRDTKSVEVAESIVGAILGKFIYKQIC